MEIDSDVKIDESLYSRQQIMMGEQAMKRMAVSNVFISGFGGLGVEIAKNVALAGVKSLTLHDTKAASWLDLSTNFYLTPEDIQKQVNRAEASLKHISQLNAYVKYSLSTADLASIDLSFFDAFKCVILTEAPLAVQIRINDYCHSKGIRFISSTTRGVFGQLFCDFGESFEIFDKNGEENREVLVGLVTQAAEATVTCLNNEKHGFEDSDLVTFREVQGMTPLNGTTFKIRVVSPSSFVLVGCDSTQWPAYSREGIVTQVKEVTTVSHVRLRDSLADPALVFADMAKMDSPVQCHLGFRALDAFAGRHNGQLPAPWDFKDAQEVVQLAQEINEKETKNKADKVDAVLVQQLAFTSRGNIAPITSFVGGVASQECLKALSGKYTPLDQWLYIDGVEVLPALETNAAEFQPANNRSDGQVICLGRSLCNKLSRANLFMIGCGAIGCEMLKNYAMLGIATDSNAVVTVTDNDLIEKSNLNRQFLFRNKDLQQPKSVSAANAVKAMNPEIRITAFQDKVGPDSEPKYNDAFFQKQDIIVNALDNVNARLYVDQRCVTNKKPLLESGTLGPKGHVQVVIPHLTESYGSQRDPPEKDVPFCTLKSFPNQIEHCIEWARDFSFGGLFVSKPMQWNQLLDEPDLVGRLGAPFGGGLDLKIVRTVHKLIKQRPQSFEDCLAYARLKFESYYRNKAIQLLHNFPLDHKVDDKGTLFWTSPKRPPRDVPFSWDDATHRLFIVALANLWAEVWSVNQRSNDDAYLRKVVESVKVPVFKPKSNKQIVTDESVKKEEGAAKEATENNNAPDEVETILQDLAKYFKQNPKVAKLKVIDFEKDDDTNFHIDFISSCANLRARMYAIREEERLRVKAIAGRIMPAIATTTAAVSGCVSLELIKLVKGDVKLEHFKNLFMNLALPFWAFTEPGAAEKKKITDKIYYTLWDQWDVKEGDITLDQFIKYFEAKYGLEVGGVFKGATMVFVPIMPGHMKRKPNKMSMLLKRKPETKYEDLIVTFAVPGGDDVSGPPIRFFYDK